MKRVEETSFTNRNEWRHSKKRKKKRGSKTRAKIFKYFYVHSDCSETRSVDGTDSTVSTSAGALSSEADSLEESRSYFSGNEARSSFEAKSPLALDCEMVGVGERRENALARCSIVNYDGNVIYDAYVTPEKPVTDYRTKWSGIRPSNLLQAVPYRAARKQVKRLIKKHILVGHSVQGDLKVLNLHHPLSLLRDTSKYVPLRILANFPPNMTPSLKRLSWNLLNTDIQLAEHCSVEDARATMNLYKLCERQWEHELRLFEGDRSQHYLEDAYWPEWTDRTNK